MGYIPISDDPQFNNNMEAFTSQTRASATVMNGMCEQLLENDTNLNNGITAANNTLSNHTTSITNINTTLSKKVDKSDTIRNVYVSTSAPTSDDGSDGDLWLVYES